jgi:hypothetical protein
MVAKRKSPEAGLIKKIRIDQLGINYQKRQEDAWKHLDKIGVEGAIKIPFTNIAIIKNVSRYRSIAREYHWAQVDANKLQDEKFALIRNSKNIEMVAIH